MKNATIMPPQNPMSSFHHASTAPTSPTRLSNLHHNMYSFYSEPTSPTMKPTVYNHDSPYENSAEFEFETSQRFNLDDDGDDYSYLGFSPTSVEAAKESYPAMAFADELFYDGKVMPLKPPPGLHDNNSSHRSSTLSSPRSPIPAVLKFQFSRRRNLWNDDFDPFIAALENVKEGNRGEPRRRARSMSPLRALSPIRNDKPIGFSNREIRPLGMVKPKGVAYARHARLVKMGHEKANRPNIFGPKETREIGARRKKRQKIMGFLFRKASMRKLRHDDDKAKDEKLCKRSFTRKFSLKSTGFGQCNEGKRVSGSEVTDMTLMQCRFKIFSCMGYGAKYVK